MKAVIYARYSSDNQREESIEGQLRECTAYCMKNDVTILRSYIDRALSAKTDNRPDFQRMIKDSAKGLFDAVIVWKLDRFARNRYDSAHYKAQLRKYGVKVLSATENISDGPEGIILESMLEGMAEYYSAELSEKVIRGHTENALKCKYNGGTPTFGYTIDSEMHYQIDPRTAPVVLEIFTRYDKGATMKEIRDYLNDTGVTTVRGRAIDLNFVAAILHNRKFLGEYKYREIVVPNGIPTIIPQDLFDRVQQRLAVNKKAPARHKAEDDYLLTTKLFCGTCGAMMVGESGTSSTEKKYHYYRCVNTKKHRTCNAKHKSIRKAPIENAVVRAVMARVMDDNFVEYIADAVMDIQSRESSVLPALRKQLEETERGIMNMLNAIQMGIINTSTKQRLDELEDRKRDIELQIIQEEMKRPMLSREDVVYWICRFRTLDVSRLEERRRLIDSFVNSVTIFDDHILITFNYKEGSERVTFDDIKSSDLKSVGGPHPARHLGGADRRGGPSAMRNRIQKRAGALLLALALCLSLAGCAGSGETVLTIGVYAGSYWDTPNGDCYQILDHAIALFEEDHPGVRVEYVSGIPTDAYSEWLAEQILMGAEPDLYFVLPEDFDLLVSSGALANLDGAMAADPAFDASLYYEPCLRSGKAGGSQYALPHESVPTIMFVNKTLLEENGVEMPGNDWTWDDFYDICARVTDVDSRRFGVYDYTWLNAMYSNGASLFSEDGRSCYLADEGVQQAVQFAKRLGELNGGYTVTARDFDMGRVAFRPFLYSEYRAYQPYPWRVKKYSSFEWDCISMPAGPSGSNVSELYTMMLGVSSRTKHGALAWELCRLLSMDESVQKELYACSHGISPLSAIAEDGEILSLLHQDVPEGSGFSRSVIHDIMSSAVVVPRFDAYSQAMIMAENAVQESADGGITGQSRMLTAQREINIFLNKS